MTEGVWRMNESWCLNECEGLDRWSYFNSILVATRNRPVAANSTKSESFALRA